MARRARADKGYMTSGKERVSYGLYFVGQNIFYLLLYMYLVPFLTDVGISAAAVGVITLIVKVWDAINDPIFGGIVDKVKFKKGKFVPWLRMSLVAIPAATIFLFAIPGGISPMAKMIWATIAYILWDTAYTICDVPIFGLVTTITSNLPERTSLISIGRVAALAAALIVGIVIPSAREAIGGWLPTVVVLSIVGIIAMFPICVTAKERVRQPESDSEMGLREMFRFIGKNKYMLIFFGALVLQGATAVSNTYGLYTARYLLKNESLMTVTSIISIIPSIIIGIFLPAITRKIDKYYLYVSCMGFAVAANIASYFVGYSNLVIYLVMLLLRTIPTMAASMLAFMFTPDCAEYGLYKSGVSAPGISFSVQTFTSKLNSALATSIGAFALSLIGFVSTEGAVQPDGFTDNLWLISLLVPIIGIILSLLLLSQYKLRDKYVKVMLKANTGEISREEADKLLEGKF